MTTNIFVNSVISLRALDLQRSRNACATLQQNCCPYWRSSIPCFVSLYGSLSCCLEVEGQKVDEGVCQWQRRRAKKSVMHEDIMGRAASA